jgi:hypothetical protein
MSRPQSGLFREFPKNIKAKKTMLDPMAITGIIIILGIVYLFGGGQGVLYFVGVILALLALAAIYDFFNEVINKRVKTAEEKKEKERLSSMSPAEKAESARSENLLQYQEIAELLVEVLRENYPASRFLKAGKAEYEEPFSDAFLLILFQSVNQLEPLDDVRLGNEKFLLKSLEKRGSFVTFIYYRELDEDHRRKIAEAIRKLGADILTMYEEIGPQEAEEFATKTLIGATEALKDKENISLWPEDLMAFLGLIKKSVNRNNGASSALNGILALLDAIKD